jgi:membrane protein YqaA with SNARE-associated domain
MKNGKKSTPTKAKKKQMKQKQQKLQRQKRKQKQQQDNGTSLWVRNFVAIANSFPNFGKGLCWVFGSFIFLGVVVFMLMGDIGSGDLMDVAKIYLNNK